MSSPSSRFERSARPGFHRIGLESVVLVPDAELTVHGRKLIEQASAVLVAVFVGVGVDFEQGGLIRTPCEEAASLDIRGAVDHFHGYLQVLVRLRARCQAAGQEECCQRSRKSLVPHAEGVSWVSAGSVSKGPADYKKAVSKMRRRTQKALRVPADRLRNYLPNRSIRVFEDAPLAAKTRSEYGSSDPPAALRTGTSGR